MLASLRRAPAFGALLSAACLLPALQACGRSNLDDFSAIDDGSGDGATGSGAQSGGGTRSGGTGGSGPVPPAGGTSSVAGRPGTAGAGGRPVGVGGSGPIGTAGQPGGGISAGGAAMGGAASEGGAALGGAPGDGGGTGEAGAPSVTCGNSSCDSDTQDCCASFTTGLNCIAKSETCEGGVLECTSGDSCPGAQVCCLSLDSIPRAVSECRRSCNSMGPGRDPQLCASDAECPNALPICRSAGGLNLGICTRR